MLTELAAEEAAVVAGEDDGFRTEPLGHRHGSAVRQLALGLGTGREHDPGRRRA